MKEPLRGISNLTDFMIADHGEQLDEEAQEKLRRMGRLTKRMQSLIDRMLHYARVGSVVEKHQSVDLNQVVSHVRESLAGQIEEEHVSVESMQMPTVTGEPILIEELFQNLVSNGIKYNESESKQIKIGFATQTNPETNERVTAFYVADNGIGIPEKFRSDVFTIFRRLHSRDAYGGGSGAGLTIVRKIIETHGGNIWIDSQYKQGTCFWFSFDPIDESIRTSFRC